MIYDLPKSVEIGGIDYKIRSDYRAILDIMTALVDPELDGREKAFITLDIFYPDFEAIPPELYKEAVDACFAFIDHGAGENKRPSPRLMDWEQDFSYIVAPINRVAGKEIRAVENLHWWTFLSYFYEIGGDCTFAQIVSIRSKLAKGKKLDKTDREWLRENRDLVDFKRKYADSDKEALAELGIK